MLAKMHLYMLAAGVLLKIARPDNEVRHEMFKFKNAEKSRFITIFVYFSREAAIFSREIAFVSCEIAISSSTSRKTQKSLKIAIFRLKHTISPAISPA